MICKVAHRRKNYGVVTTELMLNTDLSSDARFLLAMVAVLPPDWKFYCHWVRQKTGWGKDKLQKIFRELESMNFLRRICSPGKVAGKFEWEYTFVLEPEPCFPATEEPAPVNQASKPVSSKKAKVVPGKRFVQETEGEGEPPTTTKQHRVDGGTPPFGAYAQEKPKRQDSDFVKAMIQFLAENCGAEGCYFETDPMIIRTARAMGTRYDSVLAFRNDHAGLVDWIVATRPTLAEVRRTFNLDKEYA